jgi:DNA-binding IscR family transcriptional regulator
MHITNEVLNSCKVILLLHRGRKTDRQIARELGLSRFYIMWLIRRLRYACLLNCRVGLGYALDYHPNQITLARLVEAYHGICLPTGSLTSTPDINAARDIVRECVRQALSTLTPCDLPLVIDGDNRPYIHVVEPRRLPGSTEADSTHTDSTHTETDSPHQEQP